MPLTRPLSESTVAITGASSGVGAATALALARAGANVVLAARDEPALAEVARQCEALGGSALAVPTDVSDPDAVERLAATTESRFGRIDAWINNAAVAAYGRLTDLPLEELRRTIDVNLLGYLHGARAAIPRLRAAGGGVLVMVVSTLGEVSVPYLGGYTIAKHGALGLCDTLRQELRADGVRTVSVCAVLPNALDTPFFRHAGNRTGRALRPMPPVNPPGRVAVRIVRLLESPRRQARVGIGASALSWQQRLAPGLTERLLGWYGQRAQFVRGKEAPATAGNLYAPDQEPPRIEDGWRSSGNLGRHRRGDEAAPVSPTSEEQGMAHTERTIPAPPEQVFEVLRDGWTYSDWVVGSTHVRGVDADWPAPGSRIHHKSGPWPVSLHDETRVIDCEPPSRLVLRPKLWPFGELTATITLTPEAHGGTRVALDEHLSKGPMIGLRTKITDLLLHGRNRESLRRLSDLVQGRSRRQEVGNGESR